MGYMNKKRLDIYWDRLAYRAALCYNKKTIGEKRIAAMETRKLYYEDCHLKSFTARVMDCRTTDKGWLICLDRTAFYPEGGGQACDLGKLGAVNVLDVQETEGQVLHLCDGPLEPGTEVVGCIDWERRFDLMQQHSGEHILSGLVHDRFGYHNVGFHVGGELMTIDFDGPISQEALAELEEKANERIWENLPIRCWYPSPQELPFTVYRSKRALPWPVRIVEIPGTDSCACCGVHTAYTGEIGLLKIFTCVKFHQGVRLELACGKRALTYLSRVHEQNRQVSQIFSAKPMETGLAARRMSDALTGEKYRAAGLQKRIFEAIARDYKGQGRVLLFEEGLDAAGIRELAEKVAGTCGGVAAVFSGDDQSGYGLCLAAPGGEVKDLGIAAVKALNGRGGGKPGFFQGSVKASREKIQAFFRESPIWMA